MHVLKPFVCGTFHNEYDEPCVASPGSSPKKCKRKDSSKINPYSARGLDKFSELLADLDEKRQRIYSQMNPHDISFVRFVYSNTDDIVPVVVKVKNNKDQKQHNKSHELKVMKSMDKSYSTTTDQNSIQERKQHKMETHITKVANKMNFSCDMEKPSFYLPLVMMLILLLLTLFGRSVTTLCVCILWYVISTLKGSSSSSSSSSTSSSNSSTSPNTRNSMKKKDYVRGLSEKKIVSNELGAKKKDYVRGWSEKKMLVSEERKKKDYVRRCSENKITNDVLLNSPRGGDDCEASKNKVQAQHSHKKSW